MHLSQGWSIATEYKSYMLAKYAGDLPTGDLIAPRRGRSPSTSHHRTSRKTIIINSKLATGIEKNVGKWSMQFRIVTIALARLLDVVDTGIYPRIRAWRDAGPLTFLSSR